MALTPKQTTIFTKIKEIVAQQLSVKQKDIHLESNFNSDFKADSLDIVELVMALEEDFHIEIPDDVVAGMSTVNDAVKYIDKLDTDS